MIYRAIHLSYSSPDAAMLDAAEQANAYGHVFSLAWRAHPGDVRSYACPVCGLLATVTPTQGRRRYHLDMPIVPCGEVN